MLVKDEKYFSKLNSSNERKIESFLKEVLVEKTLVENILFYH